MAQPRIKMKELRTDKKLSQKQIAERVGISRSLYGHIEAGKRNPSYGLAQKIARALGVGAGTIFFDLEGFRTKQKAV